MIDGPIVLADNGSYTVKIGLIGGSNEKNHWVNPKIVYNSLSKSRFDRRITYIGNEFLKDLKDYSGLTFQFCQQKGYLCEWNHQDTIWRHIFKNELNETTTNNSSKNYYANPKKLMMTVPVFNFKSISENMIELFFEDFEMTSLSLMTVPILAHHKIDENLPTPSPNQLIVDSGFSFTHIIPIIDGRIYNEACIRIDVGGRLLTNYLREIVSYRHINLINEFWVANQIKEDCCYVADDFMSELKTIKENHKKTYYQLPNYDTVFRGRLISKDQYIELNKTEQILPLSNEPIAIPELLLKPLDIGLDQMGIGEAICTSISNCPIAVQSKLYKNITLIGGNFGFKNISNRILNEIKSLKPDFMASNNLESDPNRDSVTHAWHGGKDFLSSPDSSSYFISKAKYKELGTKRTLQYFNSLNYNSNYC